MRKITLNATLENAIGKARLTIVDSYDDVDLKKIQSQQIAHHGIISMVKCYLETRV